MQEKGSIVTGMAEVSVKELIALEKSVSDKDQTIGALRQQVDELKERVKTIKEETERVVKVITEKGKDRYTNNGYGMLVECKSDKTVEYKNLSDVIEMIRKEESEKLNVDVANLEDQINQLNIEKNKLKNDYEFKLRVTEDNSKFDKKNFEKDVNDAKEKIRKNMSETINSLEEQIDELEEELRKVKKDKTDEAIEEARKQEIIDLKERVTELESELSAKTEMGWFKALVWRLTDRKVRKEALKEVAEKKERINKISREYPNNKTWWIPNWMSGYTTTTGIEW